MKTGRVALGVCFLLALGRTASADAGLSNLGHLADGQRVTEEKHVAAPRKRKAMSPGLERIRVSGAMATRWDRR